LAVVAAFAATAAGASASRGNEQCLPSGGNGATACIIVVRTTLAGDLDSPVVTECLGEDVYVSLDLQVSELFVYNPNGTSELQRAHVSIHGTGYGLTTGTRIQFNDDGNDFIDALPNGGEIFHIVTPTQVLTKGGSLNLEFNVEAQSVVAPDGSLTNLTANVQVRCGSDHESEHLHG
jgi:hypothetical protein